MCTTYLEMSEDDSHRHKDIGGVSDHEDDDAAPHEVGEAHDFVADKKADADKKNVDKETDNSEAERTDSELESEPEDIEAELLPDTERDGLLTSIFALGPEDRLEFLAALGKKHQINPFHKEFCSASKKMVVRERDRRHDREEKKKAIVKLQHQLDEFEGGDLVPATRVGGRRRKRRGKKAHA